MDIRNSSPALMSMARSLLSKFRPGILPPAHRGSRSAWLIFFAALLFSVSLKFSITVIPILNRTLPVEADDSFTRIFHGVRMAHCFSQHCPALESLRHQFHSFPGDVATEDYDLWEIWGRTTMVSEPWPNLLEWGLHRLGVALVDGNNLLISFYPLLVMTAIGYWLLVSFGPGPAGVALTLLSVMDIDLLLFKPNEFTLGLALITWAEIRRRGASSARFLFFMVILLSGWHLIGKVWSVVSLLVYGWFAGRPLTKTEKKWLIGTLGVILLSFLLPLLLVSGSGIPTLDWITNHSPWDLFLYHLPVILDRIKYLLIFFKSPLFIVILLGVGMLSLSKLERINSLFWMFLLMLLLLASLIDYHPAHPAHLLVRIWVMFVIFLTGLFSYGIYHWAMRLRRMTTEVWQTASDTSESTRAIFIWVLILGFSLALADQLVFQIKYTLQATPHNIHKLITRHNYALGPEQPLLLHTGNTPCQTVLYSDITLVLYYLSYGGYNCGALYHSTTPKGTTWINAQPDISHLVNWNPIAVDHGNLSISPKRPITITVDDKPADGYWKMGLYNSGLAPDKVQLRQPTGNIILEKELPAGWKGWWTIGPIKEIAGQRLILASVKHATMFLTGLRVGNSDQSSGLRWPWDQGITLSVDDARAEGGTRIFSFLSANLWPKSNKTITVFNDTGSSVLATVR